MRAAALSTPEKPNEEDALDDDGEEEREVWLCNKYTITFDPKL